MRLTPWLAVLILLAGCTAPGKDGPSEPAGPEALDPPGADPESAPDAYGAGPSPGSDPSVSPADAPAPPTAPVVASCDVAHAAGPALNWPLGWVLGSMAPPTQGLVFPPGCSVGELAPSPGGRFRSAVIEFQWENDVPMQDVDFAVRAGDWVILVSQPGSPIRVELAGEQMPAEPGPVLFAMEYGGTGSYVDFKGTTWFSAFETEAAPAGYTAIP